MSASGEKLRAASDRLRAAGIESARLDARILMSYVLGIPAAMVFNHPERPLSADEEERFERVIARRQAREPVSHIIGQREFWSLTFKVTADTLDPRPDSETLIEAVLAERADRAAPLRLLDFGTGTGCLLLALLQELPMAQGWGIDISPAAVLVARENAVSLGLSNRAVFQAGNWGAGVSGGFDIIVSNPPYIPAGDIAGLEPEVALFEPLGALVGGQDGLDCYRALADDLCRLLTPGGIAALEVGLGQAGAVVSLLEEKGLVRRTVRRDLAGVERCVVMSRPLVKVQ